LTGQETKKDLEGSRSGAAKGEEEEVNSASGQQNSKHQFVLGAPKHSITNTHIDKLCSAPLSHHTNTQHRRGKTGQPTHQTNKSRIETNK